MLRRSAALLLAAMVLAGCGGSGSSPAAAPPGVRPSPDLRGLLRQPVATPSVCSTENASTYEQRRSPWVGTVDVSIYLKPSASPADVKRIGRQLRRVTFTQHVYFESRTEAYAEFQRLYTCWSQVPRSQVPASYRVVLLPTATIAQRNTLVRLMLHQPGVDSASCDPSQPCVDVVRSATANP
ncbi:MAG TPA: permease-like cell division protein FtsX [Mycobacteriales bacterium]|nr:permease-like cell division protein FtsX [Mycobacteriales bacterium]